MIFVGVKVYLSHSTFRLLYLLETAALNHALKRPLEESALGADKFIIAQRLGRRVDSPIKRRFRLHSGQSMK